jgi:hypothetical protein
MVDGENVVAFDVSVVPRRTEAQKRIFLHGSHPLLIIIIIIRELQREAKQRQLEPKACFGACFFGKKQDISGKHNNIF